MAAGPGIDAHAPAAVRPTAAATLAVAALPLPWLIDHHAQPWSSAFPEGASAAVLLVAAMAVRGRGGPLPVAHAVLVAAMLATLALQLARGHLAFAGDAWMVVLYTAVLVVGIATGAAIGRQTPAGREPLLTAFAGGLLASAAASVLLAVLQWTLLPAAHVLAADLAPGARLSANLGQPNHLGTAAFLGLCALGWLHRRGVLGTTPFAVLGPWLALGMGLSQSRTGWLQVGLLALWLLAMHRRADRPAGRAGVAGWAAVIAVYVAVAAGWPAINEGLLLDPGASMAERLSQGRRLLHLAAYADAVARAPWTGHGWLQTAAAILGDLPARPPREYVESTHNIALDLALWTGIPAAMVMLAAALGWIAWRIARCRDADTAWLLAMIGAVWVHAFTEYALYYLYFLAPVALAMGWVDARDPADAPGAAARLGRVADRARRPLALAVAVLLAVVAVDYLRAEAHLAQARLENARVGAPGIVTAAPRLHLLDQLDAMGAAFAVDPDTADPAQARAALDRLTRRYGHAPLLFKQAQLATREGRAADAGGWLARLCAWHSPWDCHGWIARWHAWAAGRPDAAAVPVPPLPPLVPTPPVPAGRDG